MDGWGRYTPNGYHCVVSKDGDRGGFHVEKGNISINNKADYSIEYEAVSSEITSIGMWTHVVAVVSSQSVEFYINGKSAAKNSYNNVNISETNNRNLFIGRYGYGENAGGTGGAGWYPFNGDIDDVRIYNRALSESEVQALYNE